MKTRIMTFIFLAFTTGLTVKAQQRQKGAELLPLVVNADGQTGTLGNVAVEINCVGRPNVYQANYAGTYTNKPGQPCYVYVQGIPTTQATQTT